MQTDIQNSDVDRFNEAWKNLQASIQIMTADGLFPSDTLGASVGRVDQGVLEAASKGMCDSVIDSLGGHVSCDVHGAMAALFSMGVLCGIEFQRLGGTST
jgi:hypothetical protein